MFNYGIPRMAEGIGGACTLTAYIWSRTSATGPGSFNKILKPRNACRSRKKWFLQARGIMIWHGARLNARAGPVRMAPGGLDLVAVVGRIVRSFVRNEVARTQPQ